MGKLALNDGWVLRSANGTVLAENIRLPHDAMRLDPRGKDSPAGETNGWIEARDYIYEKDFLLTDDDAGYSFLLEFEGVYHRCEVFLNGERLGGNHNGYIGFTLGCGAHLRFGAVNQLRVSVTNSDQPNSRWYSGTGLYRPVWLHRLPKGHVVPGSLHITTTDHTRRVLMIEGRCSTAGTGALSIWDGSTCLRTEAVETERDGSFRLSLSLTDGALWSPEHPKLYGCRVRFGEDELTETFGIRQIECSRERGFRLNGERVFLRGACVHHDNGILGACAFDFAEERKVRLLKAAGFNAIRSAHNPCSEALLRACDRLGMLVLDEYADIWYIRKTPHDYADALEAHWRGDLEQIVRKDFNHPSVVMYSLGNEVSETGQARGIALCRDMAEHLRKLDETRPVTCAVNPFFNFLSSVGLGVYSDKKAEKQGQTQRVGSAFYNWLAGLLGAKTMKLGALLAPCDRVTRDTYALLDAAGYNYGIKRYRHDLKKHPDRVILGTETFCADAAQVTQLAKKHPGVIGDFVWSGIDYLGEVGIGAWERRDYAPDPNHGPGWVSAGAGRLDLTGKETAEMRYMQAAWGLIPIGIGVFPEDRPFRRHSPSCWRMSGALESWAWNGCTRIRAEVYSTAPFVELRQSGKRPRRKRTGKNGAAVFHTYFSEGDLTAAAMDETGRMIAEKTLPAAGRETMLRLEPEEAAVRLEDGLCYVRMRYTDRRGVLKPLARGIVTVRAENAELLAAGSACPYYEGSYLTPETDTYYGEALAIFRPLQKGEIRVCASSPYGTAETRITVE